MSERLNDCVTDFIFYNSSEYKLCITFKSRKMKTLFVVLIGAAIAKCGSKVASHHVDDIGKAFKNSHNWENTCAYTTGKITARFGRSLSSDSLNMSDYLKSDARDFNQRIEKLKIEEQKKDMEKICINSLLKLEKKALQFAELSSEMAINFYSVMAQRMEPQYLEVTDEKTCKRILAKSKASFEKKLSKLEAKNKEQNLNTELTEEAEISNSPIKTN